MQQGTLYLIEASDGRRIEMCVVYSNNTHNAKTSAANWLSARPHLPLVNVRDFPGGCEIYFEGHHWYTFPDTFSISKTDNGDTASRPTNNAATGGEE